MSTSTTNTNIENKSIEELKKEFTQTDNNLDRTSYETVFMNMMTNPDYVKYSFYSFIIAKMQVAINKKVPTAGVTFYDGNFHMIVNPDFMAKQSIDTGIGLLIHESLHILMKHMMRANTRNHQLWNIACDIAINQMIEKKMLPDGAMLPETFKDPKGKTWPKNKTAEFYYELLVEEKERQEQEKQEQEGQGEGDADGEGQGGSQGESQDKDGEEKESQGGGYQPSNGNPNLTGTDEHTLDSHELWEDVSEEDKEQAEAIMEKVLQNAIEKSRGNTPVNIDEILELWARKPKISWKKVLKKILTSKKGSRVSTIKRRNRRQPRRMDIKGSKVAYDRPTIVVGVDESGSMSDEDILNGLVEINEIAKMTDSSLKVIHIDTNIQGLDEFNPKMKKYERKGSGGTYMGEAPKYILDNKIECDCLVMISDLFIENVTTDSNWMKFKKPVIWLNTSGTEMETPRHHKVFNIADA
jgi:predicted metal-dependent peptidase